MCENPVVNASIQPFLYSDTPLPWLVWGVIAYNTWPPLVLICGIMAAQRNVQNILQPLVLLLVQPLPGATFQQHSAWPHTDRVSEDCLGTVITLPWTTRSPDLSTIQHIWDHLGWRVWHPTSLKELD
ncbi:transposable element Tcb2 transposase [Trichonephila clavipes]|nr:transposable element Tcb2 transposase [Trichonephila clavipes]